MLLALRLGLASLFAVAGLAKLLDRAGTRQAAADLGAPWRLAGPLAVVVPLAELASAGALVPAGSSGAGALAALALLAVFTAAIALALRRGAAPDCHCLGGLHSARAGRRALVRNGLLMAVAAVVAADALTSHPAPPFGWVGGVGLAEIVAAGALALAGWLALAHRRLAARVRALELRPARESGDPHGSPVLAPDFALGGLDGETLTLRALRARGLPVALIFTDPECAGCRALLPRLGGWQATLAGELTVVPIGRGGAEPNRAAAQEHGISPFLIDDGGEVAAAYGAPGTPSALMVDTDGLIAGPPAAGALAIEALVARARKATLS